MKLILFFITAAILLLILAMGYLAIITSNSKLKALYSACVGVFVFVLVTSFFAYLYINSNPVNIEVPSLATLMFVGFLSLVLGLVSFVGTYFYAIAFGSLFLFAKNKFTNKNR